jgi:hypothetical protein
LHEKPIPTHIGADGIQRHHKSAYNLKSAERYEIAIDHVMTFLSDHAQYNHESPLISKYGHSISFHPEKQSLERTLNYKNALMEYALHSVTQKDPNNPDGRILDRDKVKHFRLIKEIILHADGKEETEDGVLYWKIVREGSKPAALAAMEFQKNGDEVVASKFRYVTFMPNRKIPDNKTPNANPDAVGVVPVRTIGEASQAADLAKQLYQNYVEASRK